MEKKIFTVEDYKKSIGEDKSIITTIIKVGIKKNMGMKRLEELCVNQINEFASLYPNEISDEVHEILKKHVEKVVKIELKKLEGYK